MADHIMGLDDCRRFCAPAAPAAAHLRKRGNDDRRSSGFSLAFDGRPIHKRVFPGSEPHGIDGPFTLGDLDDHSLPLPHGSMTTTWYLSCKTANGGSRIV